MSRSAERFGFPIKQKERSFWAIGETVEAFEAAAPLIEAVAERYPRLVVVLSGPDETLPALAHRFPFATVYARPADWTPAARRFIRRANFRAVAALDGVPLSPAHLRAIDDEGQTLVAIANSRGRRAAPAVAEAAEAEIILAADDAGRIALDDAVERLGAFLARDIKVRRKSANKPLSAPAWLLAAIRLPAGRQAFRARLRRIEDVAGLRDELGRPDTILCLGNGPTSEDPRLAGVAHDALFRVNHSWATRGFLTRPDVVFTGGAKTMATLDGVVFGVQSEAAERRLVGARFFNPRRGTTRFFRAPTIAPALAARSWGVVRPTNGAAMLAAAVALRPRKLVVAGIDMFRHPDGAYPGDDTTPNAFAPAHDAEAELLFLLDLFEGYDGELVLVGEVLREAWERRKSANHV